MNKAKKSRKKFVVWLYNYTDRRDDEWVVVWAHSIREAKMMDVKFDSHRFKRGDVMSAAVFRREMGMTP